MLTEVSLDRFNDLLKKARQSPFYRDLLPTHPLYSWSEFQELPLTTKDDLRKHSPFGLLCVPRHELRQYHETFGTTGQPVSVWYTEKDLHHQAMQLTKLGCRLNHDDTVLIRFPYAISGIAHMMHAAARQEGACVIPVSSRTTVSPFPRVIDLMQRLEVTVLASMPLQALLIAETAVLLGYDPKMDFPHLRALCTAGEPLPPGRREMLEHLWGVPVFDNYGMTEIGTAVVDCEFGHSHPLSEDYVLEVLSDDFQSEVEPGEMGWLVASTIWREATPLIRYFTGDRVCLIPSDCPCGKKYTMEVHGRRESVVTVGDHSFDLWDLDRILSRLPSHQFWAAGPSGGSLHIVIEAEAAQESVDTALMEYLEEENQVKLVLETVPPGTLYDRSELLSIGTVGKPQYVYSEHEMNRQTYLKATKT